MSASETSAPTCPKCGSVVVESGPEADCPLCGAHVLRFRAAGDAIELASGAGRCAQHPARDAVDGCGRCGSFVCELCRTRTAGKVLCPPCFDALHERGQLASTKSSRFRIDYFSWMVLTCVVMPPFGCLAPPASIAAAVWGLLRARREPWISRDQCFLSLSINVLILAGLAVAAYGAAAK